MRERWQRATPEVTLGLADITRLLRPVFPGAAAVASRRIGGGLANTNIKVLVKGRASPVMLRLHQRDVSEGAKEAALLGRLSERVPMPDLLYFSLDNPVTGHPYAVIDWVDGERLDILARRGHGIAALGHAVGEALARVHAITFDKYGFFGPDLTLPAAIDLDRGGLLAYIQRALIDGPGRERLGPELVAALIRLVERHGDCLSAWPGPCLAHGDFNGSNVLLRRSRDQRWEVSAIVDWEFALSGTPGFDFAQLLRPPLGLQPSLAEGVAQSYRAAGRTLPDDWRDVARMTDLFAWIDMVSRPEAGGSLIEDACSVIRATIAGRTTRSG